MHSQPVCKFSSPSPPHWSWISMECLQSWKCFTKNWILQPWTFLYFGNLMLWKQQPLLLVWRWLTSLLHGLIQVESGLALICIQPRLSVYMVQFGVLVTWQRNATVTSARWPEAAWSSCCQQHCSLLFVTLQDSVWSVGRDYWMFSTNVQCLKEKDSTDSRYGFAGLSAYDEWAPEIPPCFAYFMSSVPTSKVSLSLRRTAFAVCHGTSLHWLRRWVYASFRVMAALLTLFIDLSWFNLGWNHLRMWSQPGCNSRLITRMWTCSIRVQPRIEPGLKAPCKRGVSFSTTLKVSRIFNSFM